MGRQENIRLTRRDMLKLGAGGAGMFALTAGGLAIPRGFASGGSGGSGNVFIEAFPTSPLILNPFADTPDGQLPIPTALRPMDPGYLKGLQDAGENPYDRDKQDCFGANPNIGPMKDGYYATRYKQRLGTHQVFPGDTLPAPGADGTPATGTYNWNGKHISDANLSPFDPNSKSSAKMVAYRVRLQVAQHYFTTSKVLPIDSFGKAIAPPKGASVKLNADGSAYLPASTIYGFENNGGQSTFPGPRINAQYGMGTLVRFENELGTSTHGDFGAPNNAFLTHLHNGHTAPESDGQPHYSYHRFTTCGDSARGDDINNGGKHYRAAWEPGEWVNQMYLGYPAGGDDREKQSFFWFHDHVHGHTGANVYKGMVGLMPIYDPDKDNGNEADPNGYRLPGVRTDYGDGTFDVDYDIPMALYDCRLDDGTTPHKDAHNGNGETHPEWWGTTYFRHFPNHGFVGDVFTVNGKAYPTLRVKRRRYRFRFLDASISRIYNLQLMTSSKGPVAARDLNYTGDELQGQWRLPDGQQCMKWYQVANEGGLMPGVVERDAFELWPAKRKEFVVDFTKWMDGTSIDPSKDTVLWLVDTMKMTTGRMWDPADPAYKVPMMKIIIEADPQRTYETTDKSLPPKMLGSLRPNQPLVGTPALAAAAIKDNGIPTFELQRGSTPDPETEWLINGLAFEPTKPMISPVINSGAYWRVRNGGGGWVHPMHLHMEEHTVVGRGGKPDVAIGGTNPRHPDDIAKEDVIALDPSEETVISRRFRTFTGPYVAHCHNLAHEDHNMMFGWEIVPPGTPPPSL
jgi:FtsP/CotA-like multicopper oxidase with cupredoxin domain